MEKNKRARSNNFTKTEELMLLDEIDKQKHILECKTTDKVGPQEKREAWKKVLAAFNAKSQQLRTFLQVKSKYDNLKTKTRKVVAENKHSIIGTGGGPSELKDIDPTIEAVLKIINFKTVVGYESPWDCDNASVEQVPVTEENCKQDNIEEVDMIIEQHDLDDSSETELHTILVNEQMPLMVSNTNRTKVQVLLDADERMPSCSSQNNTHIKTTLTEQNSNTKWSKYTPKRLRQPINKQLRPSIRNPVNVAKENYYNQKTILVVDELKKRKREEEEFNNELIRKVQLHEKQMELLNVQLQLELEKKRI